MPLGADHPGQIAVEHREDPLRREGPPGPVDEGGDAVFLRLRHVIGEAVELLGPQRMLMRRLEVEQAGVEDHFQHHVEDVAQFAEPNIESRNNHALRSYFLSHAAETFHWLQSLGLSFVGPHPEPPNRVPRMHNVIPGAKAYIAAFQLALQKTGTQQIYGAAVHKLIQEGERVVGVVTSAESPADFPIRARASGEVIDSLPREISLSWLPTIW